MKRFVTVKSYNYNVYLKIFIFSCLIIIGFIIVRLSIIKFINSSKEYKINTLIRLGSNGLISDISFGDILKYNEMNSPNVIESDKEDSPIIYIYNTHMSEEYNSGELGIYNINPTVYMASNMFKDKLNELGIKSIVNDRVIKDILNDNGWGYNHSYLASRICLEDIVKDNNTLEYFLDIHRDSVSSTVNINDKVYAKMMFVIGMNHNNYKLNEELVLKLQEYLKSNYDGLMKNVLYSPKNKYNQDFSSNSVLVEIGGPDNKISEVLNSVNALAEAYKFVLVNNGR